VAVAVAHSILVQVYALLTCPVEDCHDLDGQYFDERDQQAIEPRLVRRLEGLGLPRGARTHHSHRLNAVKAILIPVTVTLADGHSKSLTAGG
jgi:hypothetical protein